MLELCEFGEWRGLPLYQCALCPYSTLDREDFIKHAESKHLGTGYDKVITYRCQACDFESEDEQRMRDHVLLKHRVLPEPPQVQRFDRFGNPTGESAATEETATAEEVVEEVTNNGTSDTDEDDD